MNFSNRLKEAMAERNMKANELAIKIGKNKSSVSQYLSGKNIPKDETKIKIAEVLDFPIEYFTIEDKTVSIDKYQYNVPISEAAKLLYKSEQFVRVSLQNGTAPFGFATKNKTKFSYHISPKKFYDYIGEK